MIVGDSWLLAGALPWEGAGLGARQWRLVATFTPGLRHIRLSPRRGSVSRASITPEPTLHVVGCQPAPGGGQAPG